METLHSPKILLCLLLPLLLLFSSLFSASSDYDLPYHYFINCGSASNLLMYGLRNFTGDEGSKVVSLSAGGNHRVVVNPNSSALEIYQTARIFRRPSSYEFKIDQNGTYAVRFHFYPFPDMGNLSAAHFSVEASTIRVLSNFSVRPNSPSIEEFFLTVPEAPGKIRIRFVPDGDSSFAFVNAIEVFLAPPGFIPNKALLVTPEGAQTDTDGLLSSAMRVIHRINVGGSNVMPENDTLLRNWIPDIKYLLTNDSATKNRNYPSKINYDEFVTRYVAPIPVYSTARELVVGNGNGSGVTNPNVSWGFDVKKRAKHLVRVHFCDVVSDTPNEVLKFYLFIYTKYSATIRPYEVFGRSQSATPFFNDYVVESDQLGFLNISIGLINDNESPRTAFLNGVEIMELVSDRVPDSGGGNGWNNRRVLVVVGSCVGGLVLVLLLAAMVLFFVLRKRDGAKTSDTFERPLTPLYVGSTHSRTTNRTVSGDDLNLGLKITFIEISHATKNFDASLMIGEGGFGKVYKGTLWNGKMAAIKRREPGHGQGFPEFQAEILVLSKIRHNHLVSLIGYCDEGDEMILVYEFMEKGTLRDHLYVFNGDAEGSKSRSELSWDQRLGICIDAAKGLHYLHTGSGTTIIHRDIKSTNILLDEHYVAKVADFGLSRSGALDETHVSTEVKGSFGYLDPEYFRYYNLTQKSDVYSFGVVLLEILCARPAINNSLPTEEVNLAEWGMSWQRRGQLEGIVDPMLVGKISADSLRRFGDTVDKCLKEFGAERPSMVDVMWDLEYCLKLQQTNRPMEPYTDSTTDMSLDFNLRHAIQRLPSHSLPGLEDEDEDEDDHESSGSNKLNTKEVSPS